MKRDNSLQVYYDERLVGTLAMTASRKVAFQYSKSWIEKGFSINPFSLPLKDQVFIPTKDYFQGLFGAFADSLPDNWGRLLLNRLLRSYKQNPDDLTVLDRLAIVGRSGMGALMYQPERAFPKQRDNLDLDELAEQCQKILNTDYFHLKNAKDILEQNALTGQGMQKEKKRSICLQLRHFWSWTLNSQVWIIMVL